ncbi:MAG: ParB/RepB/Spo0J family partition protein [Pseudobdellovibrionaceae bacterium]
MEISNENVNKKKGLGRGLGSLLGGGPHQSVGPTPQVKSPEQIVHTPKINPQKPVLTTQSIQEDVPAGLRIWTLPIEKLQAGKNQPRHTFEKVALEELAQSIRTHGVLQPLLVRKMLSGKFEIIAGERRWRAAQAAGLHEIPVLLKDFEEKEAAEIAIIENVQREDLNPVEEGRAYLKLIQDYGYTQQQVSERVGKDRATIANLMRILSLPAGALALVTSSELSLGHAKVLLALSEDPIEQLRLAKLAVEKKLSVRQLELMIKKIRGEKQSALKNADPHHNKALSQALLDGITEELQKSWGTKVSIDYSEGKGKVILHYYSDDEFSAMIEKLKLSDRK